MRRTLTCLLALSLAFGVVAARAGDLDVGEKAPPLAVEKWVKGDKVDGFEPGKIYVVEFWATWCGPCKVSIPHLTELQKQYKDVVLIGVSILEDNFAGVEPFVKEMGDKMNYRVAIDSVPQNKTPNDGKMAQGWMEASGEGGIPTAFIVSKDGRIAWIGHPMAMDDVLAKVVAGEWDINKASNERKAAKAVAKKMESLMEKLQSANSAKEGAALLPDIDSLIKETPDAEAQLAGVKFSILLLNNELEKAAAYVQTLADKAPFANNPTQLNNWAWFMIDPEANRKPSEKVVAAAIKLAKKACELTKNEEPGFLDTLALAYFKSGEKAKAIELQEKAVKMAEKEVADADDDAKAALRQQLKDLKGRLDEYRGGKPGDK